MPRYKVYGADRETGEDKVVTLTADMPDDAEAVAAARGVLVGRVVEVESSVAESSPDPRFVRTIEATGKQWKALQVFSVLAILAGLSVFIGSCALSSTDPSGHGDIPVGVTLFSLLCLLVGVPFYILGRVGAWWHHG